MDAPGQDWLNKLVQEAKDLEENIKKKCLLRAKHEGLDYDERLKDPKNEYFNNLA